MVAATANTDRKDRPIILLADYRDSLAHSLRQNLLDDQYDLYFCPTLEAIDRFLGRTTPHLLLVGSLPDTSCLEVQRLYGDRSNKVIILVDDAEVNQFFREWVKKRGVYEVISIGVGKIHLLLDAIEKAVFGIPEVGSGEEQESSLQFSYEDALRSLQEVTQVSLQYFGELVIGNYWKKAKARLADRDWQNLWSIEHNGRIRLVGGKKTLLTKLTDREFLLLQVFMRGFLAECERIIKDYREIIAVQKLSPKTTTLLSIILNH